MISRFVSKLSIPQMIVGGFLGILMIGGSLLMLPIATTSGISTPFIDAFFTATSALCVTGQITLNTATHWSYFGKTVIITLIEIGGLGIMTLVLYMFLFIGKKVNIRQQRVVSESLNLEGLSETKNVIRYVIRFSLLVQAIGALILSVDFIPKLGVLKGVYYSIFHSISAFCNAGFDLFGDSLQGFQKNPLVLFTIMALIMIGGLGFIVWRDLLTYRKNKRLLLHTRLVVVTTLIVLGISFGLLWISELRNGTFAHLGTFDQLSNTLFMTVTPRTAGYSNIDYNLASTGGIFMTYILMFIGGSSGSTAGGIKITTVAVLFLFFKAFFKGEEPNYYKRSIDRDRIKKAMLILMSGLTLVVISVTILLITQDLPKGFGLEAVMMEVFSCIGTVGLSMGLTPYLNSFGKIVLMILMFIGRVGALTVLLSFGQHDKESNIRYPKGNILIG